MGLELVFSSFVGDVGDAGMLTVTGGDSDLESRGDDRGGELLQGVATLANSSSESLPSAPPATTANPFQH